MLNRQPQVIDLEEDIIMEEKNDSEDMEELAAEPI